MSREIPTKEPKIITAGETVQWRRSDLVIDYPTAVWTLKYYIRGPKKIDLTATPDGESFLISVAPATTLTWTPGYYVWHAEVSDGTNKYIERQGSLNIVASLAAVTADGYEARSRAKIAYDECIEALASWRASSGKVKSYVIDGKQLEYTSSDEIKKDILYWFSLMTPDEQKADRILRNKPTGNTMKVRFK